MRLARPLAPLLVLLLAISCGGSTADSPQQASDELADLALRPDETPEGLSLDEEVSGPIDLLREVLPPPSDAPQLPPLAKPVRRGFLGGYETVYGGGEATVTHIASSVLRFSEAAHAAAFLTYLREIQTDALSVGASEIVETPGLGEEGYGWHRSAPGGETSGSSWRRGDLVFNLTLAGRLGEAAAARAVELARLIDQRL